MARNKHPEETVEKILAVSAKLFMEKGYEHTTLQDIIDNLGGLTRGPSTTTSRARRRSSLPSRTGWESRRRPGCGRSGTIPA